jgi:hypothetical protein
VAATTCPRPICIRAIVIIPSPKGWHSLWNVAAELRQFIQEENTVVHERHLARRRRVAPAEQPHIGDGVMGARNGRVVTTALE